MRVGIIGGGVIGAAIAFELSQYSPYQISVWDGRSSVAHQWQATSAALGVLMAVLNPKLKGKHLQLRLESLGLYETLIPQLEAITGTSLLYNRQGILQLCFEETELQGWHKTQQVRAKQGFQLGLLNRDQLLETYPQLQNAHLLNSQQGAIAAIYSPQDRQINPVALTQALLQAAKINGTQIQFKTPVYDFQTSAKDDRQQVDCVHTDRGDVAVDWLIIAAGLGSMPLTTTLKQTVPIYPVLGQALHLQRKTPTSVPMPVVTDGVIHLVPISATDVWIGATVEFPAAVGSQIDPDPYQLQTLLDQAIAIDSTLAAAEILRTWSGLRPRPHERPAPIIETLSGYRNVVVATGHYRNGVLLAPITAQKVRQLLSNSA
ncbi:MAG: FAD-binding oxidoreductase [Acaryochloris sp. SU_5_25]|nr:FAD-binding oxidoreductase [Acaryochloris sp. SU_5_25]